MPSYLINTRKQKNVAHIWEHGDTACRLYSTGGFPDKDSFQRFDNDLGRRLCKMCESVVYGAGGRPETPESRSGMLF